MCGGRYLISTHDSCPQCQLEQKKKKQTRKAHLKYKYEITLEQYEIMLKKQKGKCAICGSKDVKCGSKTHFVVDHNHKTGKVRGLLCNNCNSGIGYLEDNVKSTSGLVILYLLFTFILIWGLFSTL